MNNNKKIIIIGATSAIAEHCARLWAKDQSLDLVLVGRNLMRLERIAADLQVRNPNSHIQILQADFIDPAAIETTVNQIAVQGKIDIALITHGFLPEQAECQTNLHSCALALEVNAISPVLYAEALAKHMAKVDHGTIAIISSVAGDRGRKSNYVYGAAKGLITRYVQGLQHRFAGSGVKVIIIKPGPTDTPMTAHLQQNGLKFAPVESVARKIVDGIGRGKSVIYAPAKWRFIMMIIQHIPSYIFNRLNI